MWTNIPPSGLGVQRTFVSDVVDLAALSSTTVLFPQYPGCFGRPGICFWYPVAVAGSLSTSPTLQAGNDASQVNWLASQTVSGAAAFSAFSAGVQSQGVNQTIVTPSISLSAGPITLKVTVAATGTGGFALTARFVSFNYVIPQ